MEENKKEEIRKQAKAILANFAKSLGKIKFREEENKKKELGGFREEGAPLHPDEDFRKRMFDNASEKNEDCIIAERAKW